MAVLQPGTSSAAAEWRCVIIAELFQWTWRVFDVDQNKVIQISSPPTPRFAYICDAVNLDSELSHSLRTQVAFRARVVNYQYSFLLGRCHSRMTWRKYT